MNGFFPLNAAFGRGMMDDPDDANLVDRALRRVGVMPTPVFGSTNPVPDIYAGLERFQRALFGMKWDVPEHRRLLELEGLKEWMPPREQGYDSLRAALAHPTP